MSVTKFVTRLKSGAESKLLHDSIRNEEWCEKIFKIIESLTDKDIRIDYSTIDPELHNAINECANFQKHPCNSELPDPKSLPIANIFNTIESINSQNPLYTVDFIRESTKPGEYKHTALLISMKPMLERFDNHGKYEITTLSTNMKKFPFKSYKEWRPTTESEHLQFIELERNRSRL